MTNDGITPIPVMKVILHEHPDLDAIAAYWLATIFSQFFPGIEEAPVELWPQGPPPDGRTSEEHEEEGTICFDVGEGKFDHHPHGSKGFFDKCAIDLVAEYLKVTNKIELRRILTHIKAHDLRGPTYLSNRLREQDVSRELVEDATAMEGMSFSAIMANERRFLRNNQALIDWVYRQLTAFYEYQLRFWTKVKEEFLEKAKIFSIHDGTITYKIAVIESDIRDVGAFSRTRDGGYCDVCIHKVPETGNVFISGRLSPEQFMEIGQVLRVLEMKYRKIFTKYEFSDLTQSRMDLCPCWYLPKDFYGNVFVVINGGEKTEGSNVIEPTVLPLTTIRNAVVLAIASQRFSSVCPHTFCLNNSCGYYPYGLSRCREVHKS